MRLKKTSLLLSAFIVMIISGCANESGARIGLFSATAPVIAILQDDLFIGEATGYLDRTGVINVQSSINISLKCIGEFRYTGSKSGVAHLRCNDGNEAQLTFNSLSSLSGYGYGKTTRGPGSFTFGLTPEQASKYLTLPAGKKLIEKSEKLLMENI